MSDKSGKRPTKRSHSLLQLQSAVCYAMMKRGNFGDILSPTADFL